MAYLYGDIIAYDRYITQNNLEHTTNGVLNE